MKRIGCSQSPKRNDTQAVQGSMVLMLVCVGLLCAHHLNRLGMIIRIIHSTGTRFDGRTRRTTISQKGFLERGKKTSPSFRGPASHGAPKVTRTTPLLPFAIPRCSQPPTRTFRFQRLSSPSPRFARPNGWGRLGSGGRRKPLVIVAGEGGYCRARGSSQCVHRP